MMEAVEAVVQKAIKCRLIVLRANQKRFERQLLGSPLGENEQIRSSIGAAWAEAGMLELEWVLQIMLTAKLHQHELTIPLSPTEWGCVKAALDICIEQHGYEGVAGELDSVRQKIITHVDEADAAVADDENDTLLAATMREDLT